MFHSKNIAIVLEESRCLQHEYHKHFRYLLNFCLSMTFISFGGPSALVLMLASCNFLPNSSSLATTRRSFSKPSTCNTIRYEPILTEGDPFSIADKVGLLIFARSATYSELSFLRSRASFIFAPISVRIFFDLGSIINLLSVITQNIFYIYSYFCKKYLMLHYFLY